MSFIKKLFYFTLFLPSLAQSAGIDSMLKFADDGETFFKFINTDSERQFVRTGISELQVEGGEIVSTPYSRDNISDWTLAVKPSRTVVEPSMSKRFSVTVISDDPNYEDIDHVYSLSFSPVPFISDKDVNVISDNPLRDAKLKVSIGFSPIVIVPAKLDSPIFYSAKNEGKTLKIANQGDTYLRAVIDNCSKDVTPSNKGDCRIVKTVLSGRELSIDLYDSSNKSVDIALSTHNYKFKNSFVLEPGQSSSTEIL